MSSIKDMDQEVRVREVVDNLLKRLPVHTNFGTLEGSTRINHWIKHLNATVYLGYSEASSSIWFWEPTSYKVCNPILFERIGRVEYAWH